MLAADLTVNQVVCTIVGITASVLIYFYLRYLRKHYEEPKYLPGKYLKCKWKQWRSGGAFYGQISSRPNADLEQHTSYRGAGETGRVMSTTGVQRETSVRSIITLPAYSPSPKPTEQIIAREGERNGMDMVVEYPETTEEQEVRREQHMEALYQLRQQRRQELAEREERRRERREARARGDTAHLAQMVRESRAQSQRRQTNSNTSLDATAVQAERELRERERRISTVSYAELGQVRHDGSRVRANSHDSDHHPLLQNAFVNHSTPSLTDSPSMYSRVQSMTSSIASSSTPVTEADALTLGQSTSQISPQADERDLGTLNIPPPPDYEHLEWGDAPAYESPVRERNDQAQQRPTITTIPQIHIDVASPVVVSPVTPIETRSREMEESMSSPMETGVSSAVA